jgi:succinyl-CoA synthetase beta subunit
MNIHEYQAKELLKKYGVRIQEGILAHTPDEAEAAAKSLKREYNSDWCVIKAQIHAGGRGKGGGVKLAKSPDEAKELASKIIGMQLVTHQTGPEGKKVRKVLVAQDVYYPGASETKEYYVGVLLDRGTGRNVIMASTEGGVEIEKVAEETPEKIFKEWIDPAVGFQRSRPAKLHLLWVWKEMPLKKWLNFWIHFTRRMWIQTVPCSR